MPVVCQENSPAAQSGAQKIAMPDTKKMSAWLSGKRRGGATSKRRGAAATASLGLCVVMLGLCGVVMNAAQTAATTSPHAKMSQAATPSSQNLERQVVRLRVRPKIGGETKGLARKRFYLIKGGLEENRNFVEASKQQRTLWRECYYRSVGASEAFIRWLKENDCESVYCREADAKDVEGETAVPEFRAAYASGRREFGSRELALKWLTVNLRAEIRNGFYRCQQTALDALIKQAEDASKARVVSVMTDRKGTAYFTDLEPGTYLVSNLVAAEIGSDGILWNCELKIKTGAHGAETPFLISNQQDKNVKCIGVQQPLPACEKTAEK
jgi:hypothetical protein